MARKPSRPRDVSQLAKRIVDITTGQVEDDTSEPTMEQERASQGGQARAEALTAKKRAAIAKKAARARWKKK